MTRTPSPRKESTRRRGRGLSVARAEFRKEPRPMKSASRNPWVEGGNQKKRQKNGRENEKLNIGATEVKSGKVRKGPRPKRIKENRLAKGGLPNKEE